MKANRPYKTVQGERVTLTDREVKAYIMRVNNWTADEYNKQRYLMKNKLRTYEAFQGVPSSKAQSPVNVLYFQAKSIANARRHGEVYTPSLEMQRLQSFAGLGSAKAIQKAMANARTQERWGRQYESTTFEQFGGLLATMERAKAEYDAIKDPKAREASKLKNMAEANANIDKITDPVKREKALIAYAEKLKLTEKQKRDAVSGAAIPIASGEVAGYGDFDFDVSDYLD